MLVRPILAEVGGSGIAEVPDERRAQEQGERGDVAERSHQLSTIFFEVHFTPFCTVTSSVFSERMRRTTFPAFVLFVTTERRKNDPPGVVSPPVVFAQFPSSALNENEP